LGRAKRAAGVQIPGLGFHGEKRAGVRENRELPPKVLEALTRTNYTTLVQVYDAVDLETMREAINQKRRRA
jgi:hypothetical protein